MITRVNRIYRGLSIDVKGKTLSEVLPKLKRPVLDCQVKVTFKRRSYKGKQKKDDEVFRVVAVFNEEE